MSDVKAYVKFIMCNDSFTVGSIGFDGSNGACFSIELEEKMASTNKNFAQEFILNESEAEFELLDNSTENKLEFLKQCRLIDVCICPLVCRKVYSKKMPILESIKLYVGNEEIEYECSHVEVIV